MSLLMRRLLLPGVRPCLLRRCRAFASRADQRELSRFFEGSSIPLPLRTVLAEHSEQLLFSSSAPSVPDQSTRADKVFCNRELRLDRVNVIGFDYDYTLASYRLELQDLIYEQAKRFLLERLRYPAQLENRRYDRGFPIRGLVFDRQRGTLLKLSYALAISPDTAFLGRRRLGEAELRGMYGEALHVSPEYVKSHMLVLNDLFSLSEACLLADGRSSL